MCDVITKALCDVMEEHIVKGLNQFEYHSNEYETPKSKFLLTTNCLSMWPTSSADISHFLKD